MRSLLALLTLLSVFGSSVAKLLGDQVVLEDHETALFSGWEYKNCGSDTDPLQIKSITSIPDSPQRGKNLTVKVQATAAEPVEHGAYTDVVVQVGAVKLLHKEFDICEEARKANLTVQCPVAPGDYEVEHTVTLPMEIPPAIFTVAVIGRTADDDDLFCANFKVNFLDMKTAESEFSIQH